VARVSVPRERVPGGEGLQFDETRVCVRSASETRTGAESPRAPGRPRVGVVLWLLLRFLSRLIMRHPPRAVIVGGESLAVSEEVGLGSFEQDAFGVVDVEGDAGVDHGVTDLDDLAVEASFGVCWAGGIEVCLAESGSHAGGPVP